MEKEQEVKAGDGKNNKADKLPNFFMSEILTNWNF